jgi:hypothetical protein
MYSNYHARYSAADYCFGLTYAYAAPNSPPPLSLAQLGLIPALLCLRTDLSGAIVCLFAQPVLGSRSPTAVCLFVGQAVWPHPYLAGRLFVCSLRRGLSRPSLFVCLFQGCSRPLISILALMHSVRRICLLLSFYSASMVLSTRKFAPQTMHLPH